MAYYHRSRTTLLAITLCLVLSASVQAQQTVSVYDGSQYVLVDPRMIRGVIGYSRFGINDVDTLPDRAAQGLNIRVDARIVSVFLDRDEGFVIADALFVDLTLGLMQSDPLAYYSDPEGTFSTAMQFGYSLLAGYSNERFGVLGGKALNWSASMVGGTTLPGEQLFTFTGPWMARIEFRPAFSNEFRIMLTGWNNFNPGRMDQGFRLDIPFLPNKRIYLTYAYNHRSAEVSYATFDNYQYAPGTFSQHLFGIRVGAVY